MSLTPHIRKFGIDDVEIAEAVWYLQHAAFREEAIRIGLDRMPPLMDTIEELRQSEGQYLGYFDAAQQLIAAVLYKVEGRQLMIQRFMVDPAYFRQGIGTSLLAELLRKIPHHIAEVLASEDNEPAVRLYRKFEFRPIERLQVAPNFYLTRFTRETKEHT